MFEKHQVAITAVAAIAAINGIAAIVFTAAILAIGTIAEYLQKPQ